MESSRNADANSTPSPVDVRAAASRASVGNDTEVINDSLDNENELLGSPEQSDDEESVHTDGEDVATAEVGDGDVEMKDISGEAEDALNDVGGLFDA